VVGGSSGTTGATTGATSGDTTVRSTGPVDDADVTRFAARIRLHAARMIAQHGFGYLGQALSAAELFGALGAGHWRPGTDRLVVSPAHYIVAAYALGAELGMLSQEDLATYGHDDSRLEAVGTERSPVVDLTCGSLAQGLSAAIGFSMAARLRGEQRRVFALLSDGELEEGQLWEAALFAGHHRPPGLVVLLDANDSQVDAAVSEITTIEPIADKWRAFGWEAVEIDGNDPSAVNRALTSAPVEGSPTVIIARTSTRRGLDVILPPDADGHFIKLPPGLAERTITHLEEVARA
jgi:transketolase